MERLLVVGKENSQLHEDLRKLQNEHYHFVKALMVISKMPNEAAAIATRALQLRPLDV
jgi:hypothetical protein